MLTVHISRDQMVEELKDNQLRMAQEDGNYLNDFFRHFFSHHFTTEQLADMWKQMREEEIERMKVDGTWDKPRENTHH